MIALAGALKLGRGETWVAGGPAADPGWRL
jgi:hypothetical protein